MDREAKKLKKHFERLSYDEMKARKRAGKVKHAFRKDKGEVRESRVTEDNWEALLDQHGQARKRPSISTLLEHLGHEYEAEPEDGGSPDLEGTGIVFSVSSGRCRV